MHADCADGARLNELPGHIAGCVPAVPNALAEGFVDNVYRNVLTRVAHRFLLGCSKRVPKWTISATWPAGVSRVAGRGQHCCLSRRPSQRWTVYVGCNVPAIPKRPTCCSFSASRTEIRRVAHAL